MEAIVEPVEDVAGRQCAQPDRGQLDGQWDAVEPLANPDNLIPIAVVQFEAGCGSDCPIGKERHRVEMSSPGTSRLVCSRKRKRRYRQDLFALDAEDVPAGGKNAQPGRRGE